MVVFIWGTGFAAKELIEQELKNVKITAFIDNKMREPLPFGIRCYYPHEAVKMPYDAIIVATGYAKEIYEQASELGFDLSKFIFVYNNYFYDDMNENYELADRLFTAKYVEIIKNRYHVIRGMLLDEKVPFEFWLGTQNRHEDMFADDYNRIRAFELVVEEIRENDIPGAVAEVGVFQGEFAKYINAAFPQKVCYLFDTFEGFRFSEAEKEKKAGNCGEAFIERFKDADEKLVLKKMPFPKKVVCKKGLFPESLGGMEDIFAFVSLDVDFEQAIYDGLAYFYPRLSEGGYIFVHDYNSGTLKGVRNAIQKYENINKIRMAKVPIPDLCGTLVITK
mgnify:CR=1 FL=1